VSVERNLLISILKLTREGPVLIKNVNKDARVPSTVTLELLQNLQNQDLLYLNNGTIEVNRSDRLKLAVKAASLGAVIENISNLLCWQEFEEIAALALKNNGYSVLNNVRFKHGTKRWEIDVVGCKKPLVVCIDCKHWQHAISPSTLKRMVEWQSQRTHALAESLPKPKLKLECSQWEKAKFIPTVLSLIPSAYKFIHQVPVVSVLQLQDFISQLPAYIGDVKFFSQTFPTLSHKFEN
jgi:Holliday junction resolvase-like predicted endonuclease